MSNSIYWYFYIDIVDSSNFDLNLDEQFDRIDKFNQKIAEFVCTHKPPIVYYSYTGDGCLIVTKFDDNHNSFLFDLSIEIDQLAKQSGKEPPLSYRIGIGCSEAVLYKTRVINDQIPIDVNVPWSHNLVMTVRVMDAANENQILLTKSAFDKVIDNKILEQKYKKFLRYAGEVVPKTGNAEPAYSFSGHTNNGNNFGSIKLVASNSQKIKKKIKEQCKKYGFDKNCPFYEFSFETQEKYIENMQDLVKGKGIELTQDETRILFKSLFKNGSHYSSITRLLPSIHYREHGKKNDNFYTEQQDSNSRDLSLNKETKFYRFFILDRNVLDDDLSKNCPDGFIKWHIENKVSVYHVDLDIAEQIMKKYNIYSKENNAGIGIWIDSYALEFGPFIEYREIIKNTKNKDTMLINAFGKKIKKREFSLYSANNEKYHKIKKYFDHLISMADSNSLNEINYDYCNRIKSKR